MQNNLPYLSRPVLYSGHAVPYNPPEMTGSFPAAAEETGPRSSDNTMRRIAAFILVLLLLPAIALADLEVHFLDVGQGDCAVILCDGETMIIEGGPYGASGKVYSYVRKTLNLRHVDYLVSTHPHVDHVYGLSTVLNAAQVDLVLSPVLQWDSRSFNAMLKYAKKQDAPVTVPEEGDTLKLGNAVVTILHCWPEAIQENRTNDSSIVLRIDYGNTSFLFTGDAEDWSEYMMLDAKTNLKADVLKVAHHGSRDSSTPAFLTAVQPKYAVISAGRGNSYGHPHTEVLRRLETIGAKVLRTDLAGTIIFRSDGSTVAPV